MKFLALRCYNSILIIKVDYFKKKRLWDLLLDLDIAFFFLKLFNCCICFGVSDAG